MTQPPHWLPATVEVLLIWLTSAGLTYQGCAAFGHPISQRRALFLVACVAFPLLLLAIVSDLAGFA